MSWWGGGSNSNSNSSSSSSSDKTSYNPSSYDTGSFSQEDNSPMASSGSIEQQVQLLQQQQMVQMLIGKLTDLSFQQCVTRPSSNLSSSEEACIKFVTKKYIHTTEMVVSKFMKGGRE
jgi:hypothetical protein